MNTGTKLGAYGLLLAAVLGGGALVGTVAGPLDVGGSAGHDTAHDGAATTVDETAMEDGDRLPAAGLLVSQDGYRLEPADRLADPGAFAFTIVGPDGRAVASYDELHDRELHFIVASRDLSHFVHLHPVRDAQGRWSVDLPPLAPGAYRAFADFQPEGAHQYTLGVDLVAPGPVEASEPLAPQATDIVDGFEASLDRDADDADDADDAEVTVTVRRAGEVVITAPYLGAAGHLVALRDGDLAYLHVHPLDEQPVGPVRFAVEFPSAGTYALFFDFQVEGVVRTARFVLDVTDPATGAGHGTAAEH